MSNKEVIKRLDTLIRKTSNKNYIEYQLPFIFDSGNISYLGVVVKSFLVTIT